MKTNRISPLVCTVVAALSLFVSCKQSFATLGDVEVEQESRTNARVTLSLPRTGRAQNEETSGERALGHNIDRIVLTALDVSGAVVASSKVDAEPDESLLEAGIDVPSGMPIRVKAEVFNLTVNQTSPTVSGISESFTVLAGATVTVSITCVPAAPIAVGQEARIVSLGTDIYNNSSNERYLSTDEKWLSVLAGPGTHTVLTFDAVAAEPVKIAKLSLAAISAPQDTLGFSYEAFDAEGNPLTVSSPRTTRTGFSVILETQEGKTYYVLPYYKLMTFSADITEPRQTLCSITATPLSVSEDGLEPNDAKDAAATIEANRSYTLAVMNEDWFKLEVNSYSTLSVSCVSGNKNATFALILPDGRSAFDPASNVANPGTYYIHVYGSQGPANYELRCDLTPGPDDSFGNATRETACDLSSLASDSVFLLGGTADWFSVTLKEPAFLQVKPTFINPQNDERYAVTVYDSSLNVLRGPDIYGSTWSPTPGASEYVLAGKYFVKMEAVVGHPSFRLTSSIPSLSLSYLDAVEPNETSATATVIGNCGDQSSTSVANQKLADDDWYSYNSTHCSSLLFNFGVVESMTPEITIYDANMTVLSTESLAQWKVIGIDFTAGETYYVRVRPRWSDKEGLVKGVVNYSISLY